jgi:hypothetical protein
MLEMLLEMLKHMPVKALYGVVAMLLLRVGNTLKGKDPDNTGSDDVAGDICIAFAPAIQALEDDDDGALRKALKCVRNAIDAYLNTHPKQQPTG